MHIHVTTSLYVAKQLVSFSNYIYVHNECSFLLGTSSELHKPTNDTVNPAYHTITDDYKKPVGEPISYYEEVNKPPDVKMTQNPAYAVP